MHRVILLILLSLCGMHASVSQNVQFDWVVTTGAAPLGQQVRDIVTDDEGSIYATGYFEDTVDFDPGTAVYEVGSNGSYDIFIVKYDSNGNLDWVYTAGGASTEFSYGLTIDDDHQVYVTGSFQDTVDFDPSTWNTVTISQDWHDAFVVKLDANGQFVWVQSIGGPNGDFGIDLDVDSAGSIYITGNFRDTVDLDPGPAVELAVSQHIFGSVFVLILDPDGQYIHSFSYGGVGYSFPENILVSDSGFIYVTGAFNQTVDFHPSGTSYSATTIGSYDGFLAKHTFEDSVLWVSHWGGSPFSIVNSYGLDQGPQGRLTMVGRFNGTVDFDPGTATNALVSGGGYDGYALTLTSQGEFVHALQYSGNDDAIIRDVRYDSTGAFYMTGMYEGNTDFDPSSGSFTYSSVNGNYDIFVSAHESNGDLRWAHKVGGNLDDEAYGVAVDPSGAVVSAGCFRQNVDFDPGSGSANQNASGIFDAYILRLSSCASFISDITYMTVCDSLDSNGVVYTLSGQIPMDTTSSFTTCDTIHYLDLTVLNSGQSTDTHDVCDALIWMDGNTYTKSTDSATYLTSTVNGCDSLITLHLTVNRSFTDTMIEESCDVFTWIDGNTYTSTSDTHHVVYSTVAGCDSTIWLDLTIHPTKSDTDFIVSCAPIQWIDGNTYSASTTSVTYLGTTIHGCDSLVALDLTIEPNDTSLEVNGPSMAALQAGASYQWIHCQSSFEIIPGATDSVFLASEDGFYAVVIARLGCSDTSRCIEVSGLSATERSTTPVLLYPNPSEGEVSISTNGSFRMTRYTVRDMTGRLLLNGTTLDGKIFLPPPSGVYLVTVSNGRMKKTQKIIRINRHE